VTEHAFVIPTELGERIVQLGTGRIYSANSKDREYELTESRLRGIKVEQPLQRATPWRHMPAVDQGSTNACTVFSFANFLQCEPYRHLLAWSFEGYMERYRRAQSHDGISGPHEGSTERAVQDDAKKDGIVTEFLWVSDEDIAKEYLRTRGPMLAGTDWFPSMFVPDAHGYVEPIGQADADMGHEYMLRWYYSPRHPRYPDTYEYLNSWGPEWGDKGMFRMKGDAFRYLQIQLNGDLVSPIEAARKKK
jgi:hypothetical protein